MPDTTKEPLQESRSPLASIAKLFSILAHPQRLEILHALRQGEATNEELQQSLATTSHRLKQHLTILLQQQLIKDQQAGRRVTYRIIHPQIVLWIEEADRFLPKHTTRNIWKK